MADVPNIVGLLRLAGTIRNPTTGGTLRVQFAMSAFKIPSGRCGGGIRDGQDRGSDVAHAVNERT